MTSSPAAAQHLRDLARLRRVRDRIDRENAQPPRYVEFATPSSPVKLALYGRRALAKVAGVSPDGTGSHRLIIGSDVGPFTDPDRFAWEAASL